MKNKKRLTVDNDTQYDLVGPYDNNVAEFIKNSTTILNKLGQLEDLEEELGIDLIILLTALTRGYVFWTDDDFIYKVQVESISNCSLKVNTWYYSNFNKFIRSSDYKEFRIGFKDYGKTWSLNKEELENAQL